MLLSPHLATLRPLIPLLTLISGHGGVAVLTLLRNVLAARLIGGEQFGLAAGLVILLSGVEMATNLGTKQALVRDVAGEALAFQNTAHLLQLAQGGCAAVLIYLLAAPIAHFLGAGTHLWAFQLIAIVPLLHGLTHLDPWRFHRQSRFGPSIIAQLGPAALSFLFIWPLYLKFGDFRVVLYASLIQGIGTVIMSHLLAERRYNLCMNRVYFSRLVRFGLPLALNGLMLLSVFHGEKLIAGHLRGPEALALLAMGFTLTLTPALILGRSLQSYALPKLSSLEKSSLRFKKEADLVLLQCLIAGALFGLGLALCAIHVPTVLGLDFAALVPLFPLLATLHAIRVTKTGTSIVALAIGDSMNTVIGNLPRLMALPLIYASLQSGGTLTNALWISVLAELAGLLLALWRLRRSHPSL